MSESRVPKELHTKIFELTLALYRVTDFFPRGEVLQKNVRQKANEIFGGITEYGFSQELEKESVAIVGKVQALNGLLGIARAMGFVKPINLTVLEREYEGITAFFTKEMDELRHTKTILQNGTEQTLAETQTILKQNIKTQEVKYPENQSTLRGNMGSSPVHATKYEKESSAQVLKSDAKINERQKAILVHLQEKEQAKISDLHQFFTEISSKTIQRDLQDLVSRRLLQKEGEKRWTTYFVRK